MKIALRARVVFGAALFLAASSILTSVPAEAARYYRHCYWSHHHRHCHYHRVHHSYCYYHHCYHKRRPGWNDRS